MHCDHHTCWSVSFCKAKVMSWNESDISAINVTHVELSGITLNRIITNGRNDDTIPYYTFCKLRVFQLEILVLVLLLLEFRQQRVDLSCLLAYGLTSALVLVLYSKATH